MTNFDSPQEPHKQRLHSILSARKYYERQRSLLPPGLPPNFIGLPWETVQASMVEVPHDFIERNEAQTSEHIAGGVASSQMVGFFILLRLRRGTLGVNLQARPIRS